MEKFAPIRIRADLCRDCQACTLACSLSHEGECNLNLARLQVYKNMEQYTMRIAMCIHCKTRQCFFACPVEAITMAPGIPKRFNLNTRWEQVKKALNLKW